MNGFKTGRLVDPKTQSFNENVYAESRVSFRFSEFWLGIKAKGGAWVYTSSGTKIGFENWSKYAEFEKSKKQSCAQSSTDGNWITTRCYGKYSLRHFICEFV